MIHKIKNEVAVTRLEETIAENQEFLARTEFEPGELEGWITVLGLRMQGIVAVLTMETEDERN